MFTYSQMMRRRFGAWLALSGLVLQIIVSATHSAAHLDHLIGRFVPSVRTQLAAEFHQQPAGPTGVPAAPGEESCPLDLGLILSGTFVAPAPAAAPLLLAVELGAIEAAETVFSLSPRRHIRPPARAPPVIETVV